MLQKIIANNREQVALSNFKEILNYLNKRKIPEPECTIYSYLLEENRNASKYFDKLIQKYSQLFETEPAEYEKFQLELIIKIINKMPRLYFFEKDIISLDISREGYIIYIILDILVFPEKTPIFYKMNFIDSNLPNNQGKKISFEKLCCLFYESFSVIREVVNNCRKNLQETDDICIFDKQERFVKKAFYKFFLFFKRKIPNNKGIFLYSLLIENTSLEATLRRVLKANNILDEYKLLQDDSEYNKKFQIQLIFRMFYQLSQLEYFHDWETTDLLKAIIDTLLIPDQNPKLTNLKIKGAKRFTKISFHELCFLLLEAFPVLQEMLEAALSLREDEI